MCTFVYAMRSVRAIFAGWHDASPAMRRLVMLLWGNDPIAEAAWMKLTILLMMSVRIVFNRPAQPDSPLLKIARKWRNSAIF